MNRPKWSALVVGASLGLATAALAQDPSSTQNTTTTTEVSQDQNGATSTVKTTTIEGKVVRYEPGRTIVVLGPDNRESSYPLSSTIQVPADVQVGRTVSLYTEPSASGPVTVTRITTTSMTPDGNMKTKTETQEHSMDANGSRMSTNTTTVTGTVTAFDAGRSVTVTLPDKTTTVYTLNNSSVVPSDLAVGKTITVETTRTTSGGPLLARKITTTRTTVKKSTTSSQ